MDTTAAGDTFSGAIAVAITEKMDWNDAIQFAVKAASISVTRMGARHLFHTGRNSIVIFIIFNTCHMFIVENYGLAIALCIVTMLCWGSWANTTKLTSKTGDLNFYIGIMALVFCLLLYYWHLL
jgi:hypothetical protein